VTGPHEAVVVANRLSGPVSVRIDSEGDVAILAGHVTIFMEKERAKDLAEEILSLVIARDAEWRQGD
jgi:hypothetical protein